MSGEQHESTEPGPHREPDGSSRGAGHVPWSKPTGRYLATLSLAALEIVYGDIGTSPLYAVRECFHGTEHAFAVNEVNVMAALSLIFWSIVLVICVKYLFYVMRANNDGEGGVLALMALAFDPRRSGLGPKVVFIEYPDVPKLLDLAVARGLEVDLEEVTYVLGRETLLATERPGMAIWREEIFAFMSRNARRAAAFFNIPSDRVLEIGSQIDLRAFRPSGA